MDMKSIGVTCSTNLSTNALLQADAPGMSGSLCDNCAATCAADGQLCAPTSQAPPRVCEDSLGFTDYSQYGCGVWMGYDCADALSIGYPQKDADDLLANCPVSCGLC